MATNRISAYLAEDDPFGENTMPQSPAPLHNPLAPPANFAPVPQELLNGLSKEQVAWQQELYRTAYQSALAALAAEAMRRAGMN
jgi:hypothetical protein